MEQITLTLPQMLSEKQTARLLNCSVGALRKWRRVGGGPAFAKFQKCVRYDPRAVERFLTESSSDGKRGAKLPSATASEVPCE
jgi:hypothetical protein